MIGAFLSLWAAWHPSLRGPCACPEGRRTGALSFVLPGSCGQQRSPVGVGLATGLLCLAASWCFGASSDDLWPVRAFSTPHLCDRLVQSLVLVVRQIIPHFPVLLSQAARGLQGRPGPVSQPRAHDAGRQIAHFHLGYPLESGLQEASLRFPLVVSGGVMADAGPAIRHPFHRRDRFLPCIGGGSSTVKGGCAWKVEARMVVAVHSTSA